MRMISRFSQTRRFWASVHQALGLHTYSHFILNPTSHLPNSPIKCAKVSHHLNSLPYRTFPNPKSKIILLLCRSRILIHMPFNITALLCQCAAANLEQAHRHPGPHLGQFDRLPARAHKHVMSHFNAVGQILKRHDTATDFLTGSRGFAWGEQMLKDLHYTFAERGVEVVEYEVRVRFRDSAAGGRWQVMTEENVMEGKGGRGAVGEVRDCERGGGAAVFVQQEQVCESGGVGTRDQRR